MVGSSERQRLPVRGLIPEDDLDDKEDRGVILIHRILARIQQKAKQLADYCDPVILSISIPRADLRGGKAGRPDLIRLDLKALAGSVTILLMRLRSLSAVMISLWDIEPLPSKAGTRLANVDLVERPRKRAVEPRVRMLIQNPGAGLVLGELQAEAFRQIL